MSRWQLWQLVSAILLALAVALAPFCASAETVTDAPPVATAGARETLVLEAVVDGRPLDEPLVVQRLGALIWLRAVDAHRIGFSAIAGDADGRIELTHIKGLHLAIDDARQSITIDTADRPARQIHLHDAASETVSPTANGWGGFVNYDVTGYRDRQATTVGGAFDGTVFTPRGYGYAGAVVTVVNGRAQARRSDIGYTVEEPQRLVSATIGDFVTAASSTSRPVRMTGARIGTDFSLRPDLVTFPLPAISATAAVPTAVDLIVNGSRQSAGDVREGRFSIADLPVQTGLNTISVEVRDALGRPTLQTVSTYTSRALLRPGLRAWSAEAGFIRTGYLTEVDRYRAFGASGSYRRGISDRLTIEAHGEAAHRAASGGVGMSLALGRIGLLDVGAYASHDSASGRYGVQYAIGLERIAKPVTFSAKLIKSSTYWTDIANQYGSSTRKYSAIMNVGFDLRRFGTLGIGVIALGNGIARYDYAGRSLGPTAPRYPASTLVNATYSARLIDRLGFIANVAADTRHRGSRSISAGLQLMLGRGSGYIGVAHEAGRTGIAATVSQSAVEPGQWGYRAAVSTTQINRGGAAVNYMGRAGYAEALVDDVAGSVSAQVSLRGSAGIAAGRGFVANTMSQSFAVVSTDGQAHVPIFQDNRRIGETDGHGFLIAPNLSAYEPAKFSIDPLDIADRVAIARVQSIIRPARRVGVVVRFGMAADPARSFVVVDDRHVPVPVGSRGTLGQLDVPVGFDGSIYVPVAEHGSSIVIRLPSGPPCSADIPSSTALAASGPAVPTLICHAIILADTVPETLAQFKTSMSAWRGGDGP